MWAHRKEINRVAVLRLFFVETNAWGDTFSSRMHTRGFYLNVSAFDSLILIMFSFAEMYENMCDKCVK